MNVGAGQIKNTGYRVCVAYRTGSTQRGNYADRVPECEIDVAADEAVPLNRLQPQPAPPTPVVAPAGRWRTLALVFGLLVLGASALVVILRRHR